MIKLNSIKYVALSVLCSLAFSLTSCRSTRQIATIAVVKPISTGKLTRNIENNAFDYKHFSVKRISCQFDNGKTKASFKASIQAEKDKRIIVNLSKLNISVARVWLTPDSVKFISYMENNYFLDDYSYLSSMLDMDIDFETIHAIISNNIFSLSDNKIDDQKYQTRIDSGMYVLESVKETKARKLIPKNGEKRSERKVSKIKVNTPVHQEVYVDPETFKVRKISIEDPENSRKLNIDFSDFVPIDKKQLYPGEISLHFTGPDGFVDLRIKLAGFSTENEKDIRFKVPEKYTRINQ